MMLAKLKNIPGWNSAELLVAIAVDDYGNVRLHSAAAGNALRKKLGSPEGRFDAFDAMESREDLEALFEVLDRVRDGSGRAAVLSPYCVSMNIDFDALHESGPEHLALEPVSETFKKLEVIEAPTYRGAATLWHEGVSKGLLAPEYHGATHYSVPRVENWLREGFPELEAALAARSVALYGQSSVVTDGWTAAFGVAPTPANLRRLAGEFETGLAAFREFHQLEPTAFTPTAHVFPRAYMNIVADCGLSFIDLPRVLPSESGARLPWQRFIWTGRRLTPRLKAMVRNVMFEPGDGRDDPVGRALLQVEAAFRFQKPALISSHRVNFAGAIEPANRASGLTALENLLRQILKRWPRARFVSVRELGASINGYTSR